jgi:hypothetical protein
MKERGEQIDNIKQGSQETPAPTNSGVVNFIADGKVYAIPSDKVISFLKAKPNAKKQ